MYPSDLTDAHWSSLEPLLKPPRVNRHAGGRPRKYELRWIVERTLAWLNWSRRLSKDYELRHTSAEAMIYIAFAHMLLRRLQ
jgi:transposase